METTQFKLLNSGAIITENIIAHLPENPAEGDTFECPVKGSTVSLGFTTSEPFELLESLINGLKKELKPVSISPSIAAEAAGYGGLRLIDFLQGCIIIQPSAWAAIIPKLNNELDVQHCCLNGCCVSLSEGISYIASKNSLVIQRVTDGYWVGIFNPELIQPLTVS
jgi:hypothetical protein